MPVPNNSCLIFLLIAGLCRVLQAKGSTTNAPPSVSLTFPHAGFRFDSEFIKFEATASDRDGWISQVRFVMESERWDGVRSTNILGVVTNSPFNLVSRIQPVPCDESTITIKAVAVDNLGAISESQPVTGALSCGVPGFTTLEMISPRHGTVFSAPATFTFVADVLAAYRDSLVEFLVGTNSVGLVHTEINAMNPPVFVTVSNLSEGEYHLSVQDQLNHYCYCGQATIRVVKLAAQSPRLTPDRFLQFDVLTSFPGVDTVIQASPNLRDWTAISTNRPATNTFLFTDTSAATNAHRFYRVVIPGG